MNQQRGDALWFTDNGAVYCTDHLGVTARYSGRDISGQKIERVTLSDLRDYPILACETYKRKEVTR